MNKSSQHFVGLDIGTSRVRCVIGSLSDGDVAPTIVGVGVSNNLGVRKGSVVNIPETASAIDIAIDEAERMSGYEISSATVNVNGTHIKGMNSKGVIAVSADNREIGSEDIIRSDRRTVFFIIIFSFLLLWRMSEQRHHPFPRGDAIIIY